MTQTADATMLPQPAALSFEVVQRSVRTPRMTRLRLTSPDLADFVFVAGQDVMLAVPDGADGTINRRYTIRAHDAAARAIDLDAVVHGDGPAARWIEHAEPGDRIDGFGPRGKIVASPTADWHLFVGDESGLPAIAVMLEALPAATTAIAIVEVADTQEEQAVSTAAGTTIRWLHRDGARPGDAELLLGAVAEVALPPGAGHVYLAAELGVVSALRTALGERGVSPDAISPKAYWRRGAANAAHGEPMRDRP